jgi:hypothetical protein
MSQKHQTLHLQPVVAHSIRSLSQQPSMFYHFWTLNHSQMRKRIKCWLQLTVCPLPWIALKTALKTAITLQHQPYTLQSWNRAQRLLSCTHLLPLSLFPRLLNRHQSLQQTQILLFLITQHNLTNQMPSACWWRNEIFWKVNRSCQLYSILCLKGAGDVRSQAGAWPGVEFSCG